MAGIGNRIMVGIVRSPVHRLASRAVIGLTYADPMLMPNHRHRPVDIMAVEEFKRLKALDPL